MNYQKDAVVVELLTSYFVRDVVCHVVERVVKYDVLAVGQNLTKLRKILEENKESI